MAGISRVEIQDRVTLQRSFGGYSQDGYEERSCKSAGYDGGNCGCSWGGVSSLPMYDLDDHIPCSLSRAGSRQLLSSNLNNVEATTANDAA